MLFFFLSLIWLKRLALSPSSVTSISAAFTKANRKARPDLATTFSTVHATITDVRSLFHVQSRPNSGDGLISIFKTDPQKKLDKEQAIKVCNLKNNVVRLFTHVGPHHPTTIKRAWVHQYR